MKLLFPLVIFVSASVLSGVDTAHQLLEKMTLEEKIGQLNLYASEWDLTGPARPGSMPTV